MIRFSKSCIASVPMYILFGLSAVGANEFEIKPGPGASANQIALVEEALSKSFEHFQTVFDADLSRRQTIYISSDPEFLASAYVEEKTSSIGTMKP